MSLLKQSSTPQHRNDNMSAPGNGDNTKTLVAVSVFATILLTLAASYLAVHPELLAGLRKHGIPSDLAFICIPLAVVLFSAFKWFRAISAPIAISISVLVLMSQQQMLRPPQFITKKMISGIQGGSSDSGKETKESSEQPQNPAPPKNDIEKKEANTQAAAEVSDVTAVAFAHANQRVGLACYVAWALEDRSRKADISEWRAIAANAKIGTVSEQQVAKRREELLNRLDVVYRDGDLAAKTSRGEVYLAKIGDLLHKGK